MLRTVDFRMRPEATSVTGHSRLKMSTVANPALVHVAQGLTSDEVLRVLRPQLETLGFQVEAGKNRYEKIERPVFYGENGVPALELAGELRSPTECPLEPRKTPFSMRFLQIGCEDSSYPD